MSIQQVDLVMRGVFGIGPSAKLVLLILAEHAHRGSGETFPSIPTLARLACLSPAQARRIVHELVTQKLLIVVRQSAGFRPTVYRVNVPSPRGKSCDPYTDNRVDPRINGRVPTLASLQGLSHLDPRISAPLPLHGRTSSLPPVGGKPLEPSKANPEEPGPNPVDESTRPEPGKSILTRDENLRHVAALKRRLEAA